MHDMDRNRSQPWTRDEYIHVNGVPCVYTLGRGDEDTLTVHLPGGGNRYLPERILHARDYSIAELRALGYRVVLPRRARRVSP